MKTIHYLGLAYLRPGDEVVSLSILHRVGIVDPPVGPAVRMRDEPAAPVLADRTIRKVFFQKEPQSTRGLGRPRSYGRALSESTKPGAAF